jgi:glycosyltransferase involved in cell wall biosynthesis
MTNPRVSAVVTAYNSEAYVAEAIESILRQTCPVDEVLVVDDGSTDRTGQIVAQFENRGVKYLYQSNSGVSSARNLGIQTATGDLIAFLDADDIWLDEKNRIQTEYLLTHAKVALVSGFAWRVDTVKGDRWLTGQTQKNMKTMRREILIHNVIGNPSMVMARRSALYEAGLFDSSIRLCAEFDFWNRIAARFDVAVLPEPVIVYRWHPNNLSNTYRWERFFAYWNITRHYIKTSKSRTWQLWLLARAWSYFTLRKANFAIEEGLPRGRQISYATAALLAYPFESTGEKFRVVVHALMGNAAYRRLKGLLLSMIKVRD